MIMQIFLIAAIVSTVLMLVTLVVGDFLEGTLDGFEVGGVNITGPALFGAIAILGYVTVGAHSAGLGAVPATLVGLTAGALAGWAGGWMTTRLEQTGTKHVETKELIGQDALVITNIEPETWGQVRMEVEGIPRTFNAKAETSIEQGVQVEIVNILSSTSVAVKRKGEQ